MNRKEVIQFIEEIAGQKDAFDILERQILSIEKETLSATLLHCGAIPELFNPSSSEEKLWAKYCDIILAKVWTSLSIPAEVLRTRGDSADVFGKTATYSIVGDAKAFRLSRTARNQKDFKIHALNDWRKSDTFANLVAPSYQYLKDKSQIYSQAIEHNVTLVSYIHLKLLLDFYTGQELEPLWTIASTLPKSQSASTYWEAVDRIVCLLVGEPEDTLKDYQAELREKTKELANEGIHFWEVKIESYKKLSQEEAVSRLIKAEKIDRKIQKIKKFLHIT